MDNTKRKEDIDNTEIEQEEKEEEVEEEEEEEEEEEKRKAFVTITPWSNEDRNARFSEIKIGKDDVFVSTIFSLTIQELEPKPDEDSTTASDTTRSEDKVKTASSVEFKHDSPLLEEVVFIQSLVDSSNDEKTVDFITLSLEVEITKNLVVYTCHQYDGNKWTKTEIEQKVGRSKVEVDVYDFTTETIFFTSRYMTEEIVVPSSGFKYTNDFCTHQRITFPEGAVEGNMKITIKTMSIEAECKKKRLEKEMGSDSGISSLSDIVYIHHSQPFKNKVKVRLQLDPLFNEGKASDTFLFHCDDNGCFKILKDVKMKKVSKEEVEGNDHVYEVEVGTFSGVGGIKGNCTTQKMEKVLPKIDGSGGDQCRILVFLYKKGNDLHLWSDIVFDAKWEKRERELKERKGMIFLKEVSPPVLLKNFCRIRTTVLNQGRLLSAPEVPSNSKFMYYDRNAREIYNHFPVVPNKGITTETAIIQYDIDTSPKRLLHKAYINADLYLLRQRTLVRAEPQTPQRSKTNLGMEKDTISADQCKILVFLYKTNNHLHLWSDIVPEEKWKMRESELRERKGMIFQTLSPTVQVRNFHRVRITVLSCGRLLAAPEVSADTTFMYYDRNASEIYNHFPVVANKGITSEKAVIQYEIDTSPKRLLYTAYINAELHLL